MPVHGIRKIDMLYRMFFLPGFQRRQQFFIPDSFLFFGIGKFQKFCFVFSGYRGVSDPEPQLPLGQNIHAL